MTVGGPAALRGFRLQTLYALKCLLASQNQQMRLKLEGEEDIEQWKLSGNPISFMQVKAYSTPLALSNIDWIEDPNSSEAPPYFRRVLSRLDKHPNTEQKLIIIGEIGPELFGAWQGDVKHKAAITKKLQLRYTDQEIETIFSQVELESYSEKALETEVLIQLRIGRQGGDPQHAFEILSHWLHRLSESSASIGTVELQQKLQNIAKYLAQRSAHHQEWYQSVLPLINEITGNTGDLTSEFYKAFGARFEHIVAGVDVQRKEKLEVIAQYFKFNKIVVIHGASGQGKSALAYRFLHDYIPSQLRFEVSGGQIASVVLALIEEISILQEPTYIYVDIQPNQRDWVDLITRLSTGHPMVRILMTIREEDWAGGSALLAKVDAASLSLDFDRSEAQLLFEQLVKQQVPAAIFDFEDAWTRFEPAGPLLEFVYLVTQNERLKVRLKTQIQRLEQDIQRGELDQNTMRLLRLVSIAAAYGAKVDFARVLKVIPIAQPRLLLTRLEGEYLLRSSKDGQHLEGLHPIRSDLLVALTTDATYAPWVELGLLALEVIADEDIEIFLLHAFLRQRENIDVVLEKIFAWQPASWTAYNGILMALLWLDVKTYMESQADLIKDIYAVVSTGWMMALRWDITGMNVVWKEMMAEPFWKLINFNDEKKKLFIEFESRQSNISITFEQSQKWISSVLIAPKNPVTTQDWTAFANICYWINFRRMVWHGSKWCKELDIKGLENLPLDVLVAVIFAFSSFKDQGLLKFIQNKRAYAVKKFQRDTDTFAITENENNLKAHYIYPLPNFKQIEATSQIFDGSFQNLESMRRVELLRQLFPDAKTWGAQGYGHRSSIFPQQIDETRKEIPPKNLPPALNVLLNGIFLGLGNQMFRPLDWKDYVEQIQTIRQKNLNEIHALNLFIEKHFLREIQLPDENSNREIRQILSHIPQFPSCAFDEFGFTSEGRESARIKPFQVREKNKGQLKYKTYGELSSSVLSAFSYFHTHSFFPLYCNCILAHAETKTIRIRAMEAFDKDQNYHQPINLATHNLQKALEDLREFQHEFSEKFQKWIPDFDLVSFNQDEYESTVYLLKLWLRMAYSFTEKYPEPKKQISAIFELKLEERRKKLQKTFGKLVKQGVFIEILSESILWNREPSLWLKFDLKDPSKLYEIYQNLSDEISSALKWGSDPTAQVAIALHWKNVVIVPTIRGKALSKNAWCLATVLLYGNQSFAQAGDYRFFLHPVADEVWSQTGLHTWAISPITQIFLDAHDNVIKFLVLWSFLGSLGDSQEPTGTGQLVIDSYIENAKQVLMELVESIVNSCQLLQEVCVGKAELEELFGYFAEVINQMDNLTNGGSPQDFGYPDFATALNTLLAHTENIRLHWFNRTLPFSIS